MISIMVPMLYLICCPSNAVGAVKSAARQSCRDGWIQLRCVFAVALLGFLASCQGPNPDVKAKHEVKPIPAQVQGLLTHGPSGIKFVPQVGALRRRGTSTGVDNRPSISVLYRHTDAEFQGRGTVKYFLNAIVMVMPASVASPDKLRAMVCSKIEETYPDATHESITGPHGQGDYLVYRRDRSEFMDHLSTTKAAFTAAHPCGMEVYAFQHGEFTVLYRFEFVTVRRSEFRKAMLGFMKTFEAQQVDQASAGKGASSSS